MGAVQRLATVVMVGLVALSIILVMYAADEPSRISHAEELQQEAAVTRATANYINLCLSCHGPAGEGLMEQGRVGLPLGGNTYATEMNQQATQDGEPLSGGMEGRYDYLYDVIYNGRGNMPAWGASVGGQLNDEQVHEMVVFIQHVDWNEVYNEAVHALGGYPTVEPTAAPEETAAADEPETAETGSDSDLPNIDLIAIDIAWDQNELTGDADTEFTITITNNGNSDHDFVIDELGINSGMIGAGESVTVTINAPAGDYVFYCSVPGHRQAGMEGTLKLS